MPAPAIGAVATAEAAAVTPCIGTAAPVAGPTPALAAADLEAGRMDLAQVSRALEIAPAAPAPMPGPARDAATEDLTLDMPIPRPRM